VTQDRVVVIRKPENRKQISVYMDFGLTTMMDRGPQTVILIVPLINPRYSFFFKRTKENMVTNIRNEFDACRTAKSCNYRNATV
jgi:hypothetical protein